MKKFMSIALAAIMLLTSAVMFTSCEKKDESNEFVIGITYFEPMNYFDESGKLIGFETEFATAVCEKLGYTPRFQEIDWKVKETELNSKNIDCIWNGMTIDDDRKESMNLSDPYMKNEQVLVVKKDNLDKFSDAESFKDAVIVAESGSAGEDVATGEEMFSQSKFTGVGTQSNALLEVKSGTADCAIVDYVASIGMIGEGTDFSDLVTVDAFGFSAEEYGIGFRKEDTETRNKFQAAIDELIADGTVTKIAEKYKLEDRIITK